MKIGLMLAGLMIVAAPGVSHASSAPTAPSKCTDFSGNWKGSCTYTSADGKIDTMPTTLPLIKQVECSTFSQDNATYTIGEITSGKGKNFSISTAMDWNEDQTLLKSTVVGLATRYTKPGHSSTPIVAGRVVWSTVAEMKLVDGKLILTSSNTVDPGIVTKQSCTFDKQP